MTFPVEHTVLPVASRVLLDACKSLGLDVAALLARAGLTRAEVEDREGRLPASASDRLWTEAYALANDPALAMHVAEATPFGAYRALDFLAATGPTVGEGLMRAAAYFNLIDPRGQIRAETGPERCSFIFEGVGGRKVPQPAQEYTLTALLTRARHVAAPGWSLDSVRFTFPAPPDAREHARVFGVMPRFGAKDTALVFPRSAWDTPVLAPDPRLFATLDAHARAQSAAVDATTAQKLARALEDVLPEGEPTLAQLARRLGTSARTLQRRLEAERTSFARVVDDVRRARAERFLHDAALSIAEVAWLTGFAEQSTFARAFRRWTGSSPSEFRKRPR